MLTCSTHAYVEMNFPSETAGEKGEHFDGIAADVFLRRFIIDFHSANPVFIAFGADVFFWVAGEIGCSFSLDAAVFRLFGNADLRITPRGAIRVEGSVKSNQLVFSSSLLVLPCGADVLAVGRPMASHGEHRAHRPPSDESR